MKKEVVNGCYYDDKDIDHTTVYMSGFYDGEKKWKDKIKDVIKDIEVVKNFANKQITERIVIADSNSLNYGRKEAHDADICLLKDILQLDRNIKDKE